MRLRGSIPLLNILVLARSQRRQTAAKSPPSCRAAFAINARAKGRPSIAASNCSKTSAGSPAPPDLSRKTARASSRVKGCGSISFSQTSAPPGSSTGRREAATATPATAANCRAVSRAGPPSAACRGVSKLSRMINAGPSRKCANTPARGCVEGASPNCAATANATSEPRASVSQRTK